MRPSASGFKPTASAICSGVAPVGDSSVRDDVHTTRGDMRLRKVANQIGRAGLCYCRISRFWISQSPFTFTIVSS